MDLSIERKPPPAIADITNKVMAEVKQLAALPASIDSELLSKIYFPSWDNKPEAEKPIITLNGTTILTTQNILAVIASPGMGKSALGEAAAANYINPECDSLGLKVSGDCEGVIITDFERTRSDVWRAYERIARRAGIKNGSPLPNVVLAGLRSIPRIKERLKAIEYLLQNNPCGLLVLDGAGDLVTDSNDLEQAIECRIWAREITNKYNVSIFTNLHPNPGQDKPRGHIGSEILREAECVLLAKSSGESSRILTTDFQHGKNRNASHVTAAYQWCDEYRMFVSAEHIPQRKSNNKTALQLELILAKVLPLGISLSRTDLERKIMDMEDCSEATADRRVNALLKDDKITKGSDGNYRAKT